MKKGTTYSMTKFDPNIWLKRFHAGIGDEKKKLRKEIQHQTFAVCDSLKYQTTHDDTVELDGSKLRASSKNTRFYCYDTKFKSDKSIEILSMDSIKYDRKFDSPPKIFVIEGDCLETAILFKKKYKNRPLVLNMASDKQPGGGYRGGSGAQEENLHRRTNLFMCIEDPQKINSERTWKWPLPDLCGIYSPKVVCFRSSESEGYEFKSTPQEIDIISVCAVRRPETKEKFGIFTMSKKDTDRTLEKMRIMFRIGIQNGHMCLILSAFGCGAFRNPPEIIANLFSQVLKEDEFKGCFDQIVFAIIEDHNTGKVHNSGGNVGPFCKEFGVERLYLKDL
jgi:uncharacterized protein (TIGR02452 family)